MKGIFIKILNIGILDTDELSVQRIKQYFNTALLISASTFFYSIFGFLSGGFDLHNLGAIFFLVAAAITVICFLLNFKGKYVISSIIFLYGLSALFTVISYAYGPRTLTEYFLLVGIIIAFILFDNRKIIAYVFAAQAFLCFVGLKVIFLNYSPPLTYEHETFFTVLNSSILVFCIFLSIWHYHATSKFLLNSVKNSNKKLEQALKTKDKFFSIISHDLISPFTGIMGILEMVNNSDPELDEIEKNILLRKVEKDTQQYFSLLENLLLWSKSQTEKIKSYPEKILVCKWMLEILPILETKAEDKEICILTDFEENATVIADKNMLSTVFRNLVSNAIKFSNRGGEITIRCFSVKGMIHISIRDSGVGIDENKVSTIFSNDELKSSHGTENEKGTGLGLTICNEFAKSMGGDIWVKSVKDEGSTFTFALPKLNH